MVAQAPHVHPERGVDLEGRVCPGPRAHREPRDGGAVAVVAAAALALAAVGTALALPTLWSPARLPVDERPVAAAGGSAGPGPAAAPAAAEPAPAAAAPAPPPGPDPVDPAPVDPAPVDPALVDPAAAPPVSAFPSTGAAAVPLDLGACLRTGVADVVTAQAGLDEGCTVELAYGPARWLAAHDHDAGDAWKAMPDGAEFAYSGHTYRVVDRTRAAYVTGPVALDPLVHGDLTLQTCDGVDELVFLHATLVG